MKKKTRAAASGSGEEYGMEEYENVSDKPQIAGDEKTAAENALMRLGSALLDRLHVPEGMTLTEAVDAVLSVWENAGSAAEEPDTDEETGEEQEEAPEAPQKRSFPRPMHGSMTSDTGADYDSMSAEQFRRLKKQLRRASMDGRKIRL